MDTARPGVLRTMVTAVLEKRSPRAQAEGMGVKESEG